MKTKSTDLFNALAAIIVAIIFLGSFLISSPASTSKNDPAQTEIPFQCPTPTPVAFWVDRVDSPTSSLTQTIRASRGISQVDTGYRVFTESIQPGGFTIQLQPGLIHHLQVRSSFVPTVTIGPCVIRGYYLSASRDLQGNPLTIVQTSPPIEGTVNHLPFIQR
ncbi:MAG: hypothetical protein AAGD96_34400 [Chloroflexota bacterium]